MILPAWWQAVFPKAPQSCQAQSPIHLEVSEAFLTNRTNVTIFFMAQQQRVSTKARQRKRGRVKKTILERQNKLQYMASDTLMLTNADSMES